MKVTVDCQTGEVEAEEWTVDDEADRQARIAATEPPVDPVAAAEERLDALEAATGVIGTEENGIASRLDDLEARIADLEAT